MPDSSMSFPDNLAKIRKKCRLSQREVAHLSKMYLPNGIDVTAISKHENGQRDVSRNEIYAYGRIFKIPGHYLFSSLVSDDVLFQSLDESWGQNNGTDNPQHQPEFSGKER